MILTEQQAIDVWDILVDECEAPAASKEFICAASESHRPYLEYRFIGKLGFGGKIYLEEPPRVSCYPEDSTPGRDRMIEAANKKLKGLYESW